MISLSAFTVAPALRVSDPSGRAIEILRPQLRCLLRLPNTLLPRDAIIDTGAPMTCFPEALWRPLLTGIDFEWLPFDAGVTPPMGRMAGWTYTFRMARFLAPVTLMDYTTAVDRPGVVAAFATGNPSSVNQTKGLPPVVVGLWGGVLDGCRLAIDRNPANGHVVGALDFA